jgi:hypothetical protein
LFKLGCLQGKRQPYKPRKKCLTRQDIKYQSASCQYTVTAARAP